MNGQVYIVNWCRKACAFFNAVQIQQVRYINKHGAIDLHMCAHVSAITFVRGIEKTFPIPTILTMINVKYVLPLQNIGTYLEAKLHIFLPFKLLFQSSHTF